jgi:hypothetical protein
MGTDLIMKYNGKKIANLGRDYNYTEDGEIITSYDRIEAEDSNLQSEMCIQILPIVGYCPKNHEDLKGMLAEVEDSLGYFAEEFRKLGRQEVIATLAEDKEITFEKYS